MRKLVGVELVLTDAIKLAVPASLPKTYNLSYPDKSPVYMTFETVDKALLEAVSRAQST